ncbi:hypothetical protein X971_2962 [Agrobacterium tumefaciens LBA4213 (Ach5)]|nr:hypothetical protein X971_2962 [Agrobacterium tumefaciens LBA4213 (Ach5)]
MASDLWFQFDEVIFLQISISTRRRNKICAALVTVCAERK